MLAQIGIVSDMGRPPSDRHLEERVALRLPSELNDALRKMASDNDRTLTAEIRRALTKYLADAGYLPAEPPAKKKPAPKG